MRWIATIGMACALAAGCESNHGAGDGNLAGTQWRLSAWSASSLDPARFTITADFDEATLSGASAVNTYGGPYTATDDGSFSVGELQSTLMGGSQDAMRAEALYFDLLRQARKYVVSGATLTLKNKGHQDVLIFQSRGDNARGQDNLAFAGTVKWQALEGGFYAIDADNGRKYEPIHLPSEYRIHGLRVRVTAKERGDITSINMYGTMIEITSISRL